MCKQTCDNQVIKKKMSNKHMFLYWGLGSAPCWKVVIVLEEKGLWKGMPNKILDFSKGEQKSEEVLKLNPRGQLPTFRDGDVVVNDSGAICLYLEEKYSNDSNRLMPADSSERAAVYQKLFESSNLRDIAMVKILSYKRKIKKEDWDAGFLNDSFAKARDELQVWENYLNGRTYLVGNKFTLADVYVYPHLALMARYGACLEKKYPVLHKYCQTVGERPSIKATVPPHWKDTSRGEFLKDLTE